MEENDDEEDMDEVSMSQKGRSWWAKGESRRRQRGLYLRFARSVAENDDAVAAALLNHVSSLNMSKKHTVHLRDKAYSWR